MVSNSCFLSQFTGLQENMLYLQLENVAVHSFVREKAYNSDTQWSLVALKCASKHQRVSDQHSFQKPLKMTPEWELRSHNPVSDAYTALSHPLCQGTPNR